MQPVNKPHVSVFADGSCLRNPGPGGWAVLLRWADREKTCFGSHPQTTNNRMELTAVYQGLAALKIPCTVRVCTDSQYVVRGMTEWIHQWIRSGWRTRGKQPVQNQDLWEALQRVAQPHTVVWEWVRGHAGHPENEQVDTLARAAAVQQQVQGDQQVEEKTIWGIRE